MSGENYRRRLRALLRLAGVRRIDTLPDFERAFVHQSYAREHGGSSNDRMEFLGDSVLGCITAGWLFERFADEPEGVLTLRKAAIVNDAALAQTARRLGFGALTRLGAGMRAAGGDDNTSVLADAFEAFVGALYLRFGLEKARQFVVTEHVAQLDHSSEALLDAKTRLQHYAQEHLAATPVYREISRGTPQRPAFKSRVSVKGKILGRGEGASKKAAQQAAAQEALLTIFSAVASNGNLLGGVVEPRHRGSVPEAKAERQSVGRSATRLAGVPRGESPSGGVEPRHRGSVPEAKAERQSVARSATRLAGVPGGESPSGGVEPRHRGSVPEAKAERQSVARSATRLK